MSIKLKVFCLMSIPTLLMIAIQFSALALTYNLSLSLISSFSENLYLDQQIQMTQLLSAYSFEFNKIFQRTSQNLQIMNGLESRILRGEVILQPTFIKPKGNIEKFQSKTENPQLLAVASRNSNLVSSWTSANIKDENKLSSLSTIQLQVASHSEFLKKAIKLENNNNSASTRDVTINGIYQGFANDGMFSTVNYNKKLYTTYVPPDGCIYTGPYKYDCRCRQWFLEPINRPYITPIEPQLYFDIPNNPTLGSNLCKREPQYVFSSNGTLTGISSCRGYSVNCMTFQLSFIRQFFDTVSFKNSKTIMIDPRSQKVVYNSISGMPKSITYLSTAIQDIFPLDTKKQGELLKEIQQKIPRQHAENSELNIDEAGTITTNESRKELCNNDVMETSKKLLGLPSVDYEQYSEIVNKNNFSDPEFLRARHNAKSFVFKASDGEELFVAINAIMSIEKLREIARNNSTKSKNNGDFFQLQDLFLVIDILPKKLLTTWTDKLIRQIQQYLIFFGIAAIVLCVVFLSVTGVISYKVCLMIEVPIVHMTDLLKKFQEEGEGEQEGQIEGKLQIVLRQIEQSSVFQDEMEFLSLDVKILFESFICIFRMLHLATQDIFTVDSSHSLLQLNYQINFFRQFRNTRVLGICYNNIGNIHFQNKRYLESMENYQQALIFANYEQGQYAEEGLKDVNANNQMADAVLDVIFSRKLNFSFALYMHNVSQKDKDKNNATTANFRMQQIISTILIEWEMYERVLLQLIEINGQFTEFSYGRSVILCCQLSLCYLKMNQLEKAIQFQGQAIADYQVTLMIEKIRMKNNKFCQEEAILTSTSHSPQFDLMGIRESSVKDQEIVICNQQSSCLKDDTRRDFIREYLETRRIEYEKAEICVLDKETDRISKVRQLQIKQELINNTNICSTNLNSKNTFVQKNQPQQKPEGKIFRSMTKMRTKLRLQNGCKFMTINDSLDGTINCNKNQTDFSIEDSSQKRYMKEGSIQSSKGKQTTFRSKQISILSKLTTSQDKTYNTQSQLSPCLGKTDPQQFIKQPQGIRKSSKSYGGTQGNARDIQNNQSISRKSIKPPNLQPLNNRVISLSAYHRPQQSLSITTQQPIAQYDFLKKQNISHSYYKSMVNKNLLEEDLQQIQRFELPNDVLLQKISIQEARILMSEKKYYEASLVLTELLEKTKFYLPFDRLKNLSILEEILLCFEVNASPMRKMINRFDENIMFSVSTVLAVKKEHSKAASACAYLVNEVLTNEHDKFALMVYSQNSFEQAIPSVEIKQLRAMKELISEIIQDLSGAKSSYENNSNEDIIFGNKNSINHSIYQEKNDNINVNNGKDISMDCISPDVKTNLSKKQLTQKDVKIQYFFPPNFVNNKSLKDNNTTLNGQDQLINSPQLSKISNNNKDSPLLRRCSTHYSKSEKAKQKDSLNNEPFPLSFLEYPQFTPTKNNNDEYEGSNRKHETNQLILSPTRQISPLSQRQQTSLTEDSLAEMSRSNFSVSQTPKIQKRQHSQFFLYQKTNSIQINSPRIIQDLLGNIGSLISYTSQDCIDQSRSEEDKQNDKLDCLVNSEDQGCFDGGLFSPKTQAQNMKTSMNEQEQKLSIIQEKQQVLQTVINVENLPEQTGKMIKKQNLSIEIEEKIKEQQQISSQIHQISHQQQCQYDSFKCSTSKNYNQFPLGSIRLLSSEKGNEILKLSSSVETSASNLSKENINFVFHFALRKAILGYFGQDPGQLHIQKRLNELNSTNKSRKFILFITDQTGISANNKAYSMLTRLLFESQIQLLVLQLQFEESLEEKNEISDCFIENKPVIKYFYTQEKMLQYIRNKREPMKNFGIPLLVEHFSV